MSETSVPGGLRICVVGDETVAGVGDPKALGWVGRVAARTPAPIAGMAVFPLGVPHEGTAALNERWSQETSPRFGQSCDNRLVVGLGAADLTLGTTLARSRLNLANVLDEASSRGLATFVVGPAPLGESSRNEALGELAGAFGDVCSRRDVPYVDCFSPLVKHAQWYADLAASDGVHPGQAGYGLLAWLVLHAGWHDWLGIAA